MKSLAAPTISCRTRCGLAVCAVALLLVSGCGSTAIAGAPVAGTLVGVTEHDFHIATTIASVPTGEVNLRIQNQGPDEHELIVAPVRKGGLPIRSDGFTVNEEAIQSSEPGSITPQQPGGTEYLRLHLAPGRYVLFCNMEGHYMAGMHTELVVR
jgi:uncharacterized cupredoxin-like copper-binding protein